MPIPYGTTNCEYTTTIRFTYNLQLIENENNEQVIIFLLCASALFPQKGNAQISTYEEPFSFGTQNQSYMIPNVQSIDLKTVSLPLTLKEIDEEDIQDEANGIPIRFGYSISVKYDMTNAGTWTKLTNGGKLWQFTIHSPGALSINLLYDKFWMPEGAKFFVYSADKKQHIGAFTSQNNKGDSIDVEGFATGLVFGDKVTLEHYEPAGSHYFHSARCTWLQIYLPLRRST